MHEMRKTHSDSLLQLLYFRILGTMYKFDIKSRFLEDDDMIFWVVKAFYSSHLEWAKGAVSSGILSVGGIWGSSADMGIFGL